MDKVGSRLLTTSNSYRKQAEKKVSFSGNTIVEDDNGNMSYSIYLPANNTKDVKLEIVSLSRDKNGDYSQSGDKKILSPNNDGFMKIWSADSPENKDLAITNPDNKLGYKFLVDGKPVLDNVKQEKIGKDDYNIAWDPARPVLKKNRQLYHLMPDMAKTTGPGRRNHFNVFGGNINDVRNKLDYIKDMGLNTILSTPVFNNGPKNANGYWTKNPYQVDPLRGSSNEFKGLQKDLYRRGMGFIADGAFVNESWEGVHVKNAIKYGKRSPFFNWLEVTNKDDKLRAELLPDRNNEKALANLGIKVINGPYKLVYGKEGNPVVEESFHNPKLPTKIQLFDRRFASLEQQNSDKQIKTSAKKEPDDPNELKTFSDSVQLAAFEVKPESVADFLKKKEEVKPLDFARNDDWGNDFKLAYPGEGSNASPWDGQKDILKLKYFMNDAEVRKLSNSTRSEDQLKLESLQKTTSQVQDNTIQVGEFWTSEVENSLSEYTAKNLGKDLSQKGYKDDLPVEDKAKLIKSSIDNLSKPAQKGEPPILPEKSSAINEKQIANILKSNYDSKKAAYSGDYNMKISPLPKNITDAMMSYPLESIDFPDEIASTLASPFIKKLAPTPQLIGVSRYDMMKKPEYQDAYNKMSPVYKKTDRLYTEKLAPLAQDIIKQSDKLSAKMLDKEGKLSQQGKELFKVVAPDMTKFIVVKAIANENPTKESLEKGESLDYNREELGKKAFKNLLYKSEQSPEAEANSMVDSISDGLSRIKPEDKKNFAGYLEKRLDNINQDTMKVSKLILNKTESGLEWRIDATKDVMNKVNVTNEDGVRGENTFSESWDRTIDFWSKFNNGVRKHNPRAFMIGETTSLGEFTPAEPKDKKGLMRGNYPKNSTVESKFIDGTKFTTQTNYMYLFGSLPKLVHGAPYSGDANQHFGGNVNNFMNNTLLKGWCPGEVYEGKGYLTSGPVDNILYSHVASANHDMSRVMHGMTQNISEFVGDIKNIDQKKSNWQGTKIEQRLNEFENLQNAKNKKMQGINDIFKTAFNDGWYEKLSPEEQLAQTNNNWNAGWIKDDSRLAKAGMKDNYIKETEKLKNDEEFADINQDLFRAKELDVPAIVMADTILGSYKKATKELGITNPKLDNAIKSSAANIATGSFKGKQDDFTPSHFARRPIHYNWKDITEEAKRLDKTAFEGINKEQESKLADKVMQKFLEPGLKKAAALEQYKVVLPGAPTVYAGDELAETGFESAGKNVYLQNRHRLSYNWLKEKPYIKEFNNQIKQAENLRNREELSPLVNGQLVPLKPLKNPDGAENANLYGIYRYNKDRDVIAVMNVAGFDNTRKGSDLVPQKIKSIDTTNGINDGIETGIKGGIKDGTEYINAMNQKDEYIVKNGQIINKKGDITIDKPVLLLYRKKKFSEN